MILVREYCVWSMLPVSWCSVTVVKYSGLLCGFLKLYLSIQYNMRNVRSKDHRKNDQNTATTWVKGMIPPVEKKSSQIMQLVRKNSTCRRVGESLKQMLNGLMACPSGGPAAEESCSAPRLLLVLRDTRDETRSSPSTNANLLPVHWLKKNIEVSFSLWIYLFLLPFLSFLFVLPSSLGLSSSPTFFPPPPYLASRSA